MALTTTELLTDLPAVLDLLNTLQDALKATKGQPSLTRDFAIIEAVLPKVKALALAVEAQVAS